MSLEGMQEPGLWGRTQGRLCTLLQVEQDTGVGSSCSNCSSPSQRQTPARPDPSERAGVEQQGSQMDMGSDGQGLRQASAFSGPVTLGTAQGPQSPYLHLQSEDNNAKHSHMAGLWGKNVLLYI